MMRGVVVVALTIALAVVLRPKSDASAGPTTQGDSGPKRQQESTTQGGDGGSPAAVSEESTTGGMGISGGTESTTGGMGISGGTESTTGGMGISGGTGTTGASNLTSKSTPKPPGPRPQTPDVLRAVETTPGESPAVTTPSGVNPVGGLSVSALVTALVVSALGRIFSI